MMPPARLRSSVIAAVLLVFPPAAPAQSVAHGPFESTLSAGFKFTERSGEELYASVCGGCHMPDGKGAIGAGTYPPLAGDKRLEAGDYPVYVVVNGQRAMPPLGDMLSDDQVAAVVNYVRTHFGNNYQDALKPEDVTAARQKQLQ
jgi:mono/diheme cytochrome c family protein